MNTLSDRFAPGTRPYLTMGAAALSGVSALAGAAAITAGWPLLALVAFAVCAAGLAYFWLATARLDNLIAARQALPFEHTGVSVALDVLLRAPLRAPLPSGTPAKPLYEDATVKRDLPPGVPSVLGVCGKPRAGKDVIADYVQAHYAGVERLAFSDAIIEEVNAFLARFPVWTLHGRRPHKVDATTKSEPAYRRLLQEWGMGRPETSGANYWADAVVAAVEARKAAGARLVVVTGVRLPVDVELIRERLHGLVFRAERPGNPYQAEHAVEAALDELPDTEFKTVLNPVEGELAPYEANIEAALEDVAVARA